MNRDFVEMLFALSETGVEFLIVGAYAVAAHGQPRANDRTRVISVRQATAEEIVFYESGKIR